MIPLLWFFIGWLVFVGCFALMALLTVLMNVRYGLTSAGTYISTAAFLIVIAIVLISMGGYAFTVNWNQSVNVIGPSNSGEIQY